MMNVKFAYALGDIRIFTLKDNSNVAAFSMLVFIIALEPCNVDDERTRTHLRPPSHSTSWSKNRSSVSPDLLSSERAGPSPSSAPAMFPVRSGVT